METNNSVRILFVSPDSLNFAIYVGCAYGIIPFQSRDELWPYEELTNDLPSERSTLSNQWIEWWEALIRERYNQINNQSKTFRINGLFEPPNFLSMIDTDLQLCCKKAWPRFEQWWNITAGGRNALSFFEKLHSEDIQRHISNFKMGIGRELKPFDLQIDYIYTGFPNALQISPTHLITTPAGLRMHDDEWWIEKLNQIG